MKLFEEQNYNKDYLENYIGVSDQSAEQLVLSMIRLAMSSVSFLCILPMQDLLELDSRHRMNIPGTSDGNWQWGFDWKQVPVDLANRLRHLNSVYGRIP